MTLPALFEIHPPPWKADGDMVRDANGLPVAMALTYDRDTERPLARLLAAAPGLVEALDGVTEAAEQHLDGGPYGPMVMEAEDRKAARRACNKARAALAALKEEA